MYIYLITNLLNEKKYVGQTIQKPENRFYYHKWNANNYSDYYIHRAIRKYRIENFSFEVIDDLSVSSDELNEAEIEWIASYNTFFGDGYNMTSGGEQGKIVSEETRKKMSESSKGQKSWNKGKTGVYSKETLQKMSNTQRGKKVSKETKRKISEASKGEKNSFYGKKHTNETRKKISKAKIGKKSSKETKLKQSLSMKNKFLGLKSNCSKKVIQIDKKTGEEITCWFSMGIIQLELNINKAHISKCCNRKQKSAGGFVWRFV